MQIIRSLKKIPLRVWLFYLLLISILFTGVTFASYKSESSGGSTTKVALFANDTAVNIPITEVYPGCTFEVPITVLNYEGDKVCEVSERYEIEAILVTERLPLTINWRNDEEPNQAGNVYGDMHVAGGKQEKTHTLVVSWPAGNANYEYADEIEVIRIIIHCEQID